MMKLVKIFCALLLGLSASPTNSFAQTAGQAKLEVTLLDYNGSGTAHYCVAWVTTESGAFIKSLRKQGPNSWTSSQWGTHCGTWNTVRAGSTNLDGYSSATATTYSGTNSPVILTWNCRDTNNVLVADGNYKFWVQYAEENNNIPGPYTTNGLLWIKGTASTNNSYANIGANFANLKVTWTVSVSALAPTITSAAPTATGTVGVPYSYSCTATGTIPILFAATNLPTGLTISTNGQISGIPLVEGTYGGTISATNGTLPDATQSFTIAISAVPVTIASVGMEGGNLVMGGSGPANGVYTVLTSTNASETINQWTPIATDTIGSDGSFGFTNAIDATPLQKFYRLRLP